MVSWVLELKAWWLWDECFIYWTIFSQHPWFVSVFSSFQNSHLKLGYRRIRNMGFDSLHDVSPKSYLLNVGMVQMLLSLPTFACYVLSPSGVMSAARTSGKSLLKKTHRTDCPLYYLKTQLGFSMYELESRAYSRHWLYWTLHLDLQASSVDQREKITGIYEPVCIWCSVVDKQNKVMHPSWLRLIQYINKTLGNPYSQQCARHERFPVRISS